MSVSLMRTRLSLLTQRDELATTIGSSSTLLSPGHYSDGSGLMREIGLAQGRMRGIENAMSNNDRAKKDTIANIRARAGEHGRTFNAQCLYERGQAAAELKTKLDVLRIAKQELDLAEKAIRTFDHDNPDLAAYSESDLLNLIAANTTDSQPEGAGPIQPSEARDESPTTRLTTERSSDIAHSEEVETYLSNQS